MIMGAADSVSPSLTGHEPERLSYKPRLLGRGPGFTIIAEPITMLTITGALLVVCGATVVAIGER